MSEALSVEDLRLHRDGAEIVSGAVSRFDVDELRASFESDGTARAGTRSFTVPEPVRRAFCATGPLGSLAQAKLGVPLRPVRIVLFDKTARTNWSVPWHQDRTIAVRARHDLPGFSNWNVKSGTVHVEPPVELLQRMVTLRLHLDDTDADNGPLDIVPGSHRLGRIPAAAAMQCGRAGPTICCRAATGDVVLMRLLTVHKSERSTRAERRRVIHVDYSPDELPSPLAWQSTVA